MIRSAGPSERQPVGVPRDAQNQGFQSLDSLADRFVRLESEPHNKECAELG